MITTKLIPHELYQQDLISTKNLSLEVVDLILKTANQFKQQAPKPYLANKIIANCFFEPSTRTRLSFEAATFRLGGNCIGFASDDATSVQKGETLADTIRMVSAYSDLIVIRHPQEGAAALAAEVADCPVINAGDGANQHPTQALLDLFSIHECQKNMNGLAIGLVGDLKYGRTIHSLTSLCALYDVRLYLVAPDNLSLPDSICDNLKKSGIRFSFHQDINEVISKIDILYMTRIQQERFGHVSDDLLKNPYTLTNELLKSAKPNLKILHPLPRVNEIAVEVDKSPFAYYFQQAKNGLYVREAILTLLLNESLP
jgi:aspartate carbamoyltransferase catalytic subunit